MSVRLLAILFLVAFTPAAQSAEFGSSDEAVVIVKRVQEKFKRDGKEATFAAITGRAPGFHDHDLYAFVYDINGKNVAHGANSVLVGQNRIGLQDQNKKFVISEFIKVAQTKGSGWIDYCWPNPVSVEDMASYIERLDENYFVGVAIFRKDPPFRQARRDD